MTKEKIDENDLDLTDRKEAHEQEKREHLLATQSRSDWQMTMHTPEGRRVVREILELTGYHRDPFDKHGSLMAHNCGRLFVGRGIESKLQEHCPDFYRTLLANTDAPV